MPNELPSNKISIYLIKEGINDYSQILKNHDKLQSKNIEGLGTVYFGESHTYKPSWLQNFFLSELDDVENIFNSGSRAVFFVEVNVTETEKRLFAIPFGYGWNFLNPGVWEERFGLKVVLNTINPQSIRRIDKKNMSSVPKDTSEQLSVAGIAADFGVDIEQDLIRSVTGKSKDTSLGTTITGKDSLSISAKVNLSNIKALLENVYKKYLSNDYKADFGWIDQIAEVKDPTLVDKLNNSLIEQIQGANTEKIWMAVPELIEWEDVSGFRYKDRQNLQKEEDIGLSGFFKSLDETQRNSLTLDILKNKKIFCYSYATDEVKYQWKAYDCIYCELENVEDGKTYLLSNGQWFDIQKDFATKVNDEFVEIRGRASVVSLPNFNNSQNEAKYNESVPTSVQNLTCMDRKIVQHGGGYSRIEFCDLLSTDKKIIHVKYYGGSAVLSHLFSQGVVSGELFLADKEFRQKVNEKLPAAYKMQNPDSKPNSSEYTVVFAVISSSPKDLDIPFFSKVSLRNARRRLETYGYKVALQKIGISEAV